MLFNTFLQLDKRACCTEHRGGRVKLVSPPIGSDPGTSQGPMQLFSGALQHVERTENHVECERTIRRAEQERYTNDLASYHHRPGKRGAAREIAPRSEERRVGTA